MVKIACARCHEPFDFPEHRLVDLEPIPSDRDGPPAYTIIGCGDFPVCYRCCARPPLSPAVRRTPTNDVGWVQ